MKQEWANISNEEYHNSPKYKWCMTHSGLVEFAKSPAHWLAWRNAESKKSPALNYGQAYHLMMLEPEKFERQCLVFEGVKRGKKYEEFLTKVPRDSCILSPDECVQLYEMKKVAKSHLVANGLTNPGAMVAERAGFFKIEPYDFWISIKPDIRNKNLLLLADVKTARSASPDEFSKAIGNFKYHWQAWLYSKGASILDKFTYKDWIWLVQEKTAPYPIAAYRATERMLMKAQGQIIPLFEKFQWCLTNDQWPSYFQDDQVIDIELPRWA